MKTIQFSMLLSFLFISLFSLAQTSKKETIKVWGACSMCEKTIETAAKNAGASKADWNESTKELAVTYNSKKTSGTKIQESIAAAGYDTQDFTASDAVYNSLHACCQYERKASTANVKIACCAKDMNGKMVCADEKCTASCCTKDANGVKICTDEGACAKSGCCSRMSAAGDHMKAACCAKDSNGKMVCADEKCTASCCTKDANGVKVCTDEQACQKSGCCKK